MTRRAAEIYANLGQKDKAFEWLEKAYADRTIGVDSTLKTDPVFDPLRSDPRFASLLRRMNWTCSQCTAAMKV